MGTLGQVTSAKQQSQGNGNAEKQRARRTLFSPFSVALGRSVRWASRLAHRGGSALPGAIVEKVDPGFLARTLAQIPLGVVLVSGTNGKTTTTRMIAHMFEDLGLRVFTNPTGSNFTRGVVSALVSSASLSGKIDADIAVLELDEAYAVHFVQQVRPRYSVLLNVLRDQLDRFGEIDTTASLLRAVAQHTSKTVVLNREDPRISALSAAVPSSCNVQYFGISEQLRTLFPTDDAMRNSNAERAASGDLPQALAVLETVGKHHATYLLDGKRFETDVKLEGVYNLYNAAAALAVVTQVVRDVKSRSQQLIADKGAKKALANSERGQRLQRFSAVTKQDIVTAVSQVTPAFGRGETIDVDGTAVELVLVKNPMGFRMALASFDPHATDTMIAINDEYADGRDMSWLWDVDFDSLRDSGVAMVSGVRAWDMALRLGYEQVPVARVEENLQSALHEFLVESTGTTGTDESAGTDKSVASDETTGTDARLESTEFGTNKTKRIYCTYTAMLALRSELGRITEVTDAGVGA